MMRNEKKKKEEEEPIIFNMYNPRRNEKVEQEMKQTHMHS